MLGDVTTLTNHLHPAFHLPAWAGLIKHWALSNENNYGVPWMNFPQHFFQAKQKNKKHQERQNGVKTPKNQIFLQRGIIITTPFGCVDWSSFI